MIKFQGLTKNFGKNTVLNNVSGHVGFGKVVALLGPSGSGKSTLLRCLNLLEHPDAGEILIQNNNILAPGCDIRRLREKMGMVFQLFHLFPNMTVLENITYAPRKVLNLSTKDAEELGQKLLVRVGLEDKGHAYPSRLSGGQKQRVAIARALAMNPEVLLFDEPTSALDPEMVKEVLDVIKGLAHSDMTILLVTHEMQFAREVADEIWFLDKGEILERANPQDFFNKPTTQRAQEFLDKVL